MTATKPRKPRTLDEITKEVVMETIEKKKSRTKLEQMAAEYAEREVPASDDPDGWTDYKFYREVVTRHYLAGFEAACNEALEEAVEISYSWEDLEARVKEINKGGLILSNQYGMVYLLNQQNQIILNLSPLLTREERMRHA